MLILILIDVQYSQKAVFSFEKGLNGQNHSSGSHHPIKSPQQNFLAYSRKVEMVANWLVIWNSGCPYENSIVNNVGKP